MRRHSNRVGRELCLWFALFAVLCLGTFRSLAQGTVTATWYFSDIVANSNNVGYVKGTPVNAPWVNPSQFLLARPFRASVATYPLLTNGSFTTNIVVGVPFEVDISDGVVINSYTNYFPTNLAGSAVNAYNYRGFIAGPIFAYLNPIITNATVNGAATVLHTNGPAFIAGTVLFDNTNWDPLGFAALFGQAGSNYTFSSSNTLYGNSFAAMQAPSNYTFSTSNTLSGAALTLAQANSNFTFSTSNTLSGVPFTLAQANSNYTFSTSNSIIGTANAATQAGSNYTYSTSNSVYANAFAAMQAPSNFTYSTSNTLSTAALSLAQANSNYTFSTSNTLSGVPSALAQANSNYTYSTSNTLYGNSFSTLQAPSNFTYSTSNTLSGAALTLAQQGSNYTFSSSNTTYANAFAAMQAPSNYTYSTSNTLYGNSFSTLQAPSNFVYSTSNTLSSAALTLAQANSNYTYSTSNSISLVPAALAQANSNYTYSTSNTLYGNSFSTLQAPSNYTYSTSNTLSSAALTLAQANSNYTFSSSNTLYGNAFAAMQAPSNYTFSTSNTLYGNSFAAMQAPSNYTFSTSNTLYGNSFSTLQAPSNFTYTTSNTLSSAALTLAQANSNYTFNTSNTLQGNINGKVSIISGTSGSQVGTNLIFTDNSGQGLFVTNFVGAASGHRGYLQFNVGGLTNLEVGSNNMWGVATGLSNASGSLVAFDADLISATNNVNAMQTNNTTSVSNVLQTAINGKLNTNNGISYLQTLSGAVIADSLTFSNTANPGTAHANFGEQSGSRNLQLNFGGASTLFSWQSNGTASASTNTSTAYASAPVLESYTNVLGDFTNQQVLTNILYIKGLPANMAFLQYGGYEFVAALNIYTNKTAPAWATNTTVGIVFYTNSTGLYASSAGGGTYPQTANGENGATGSGTVNYGIRSDFGNAALTNFPTAQLTGTAPINITGNAATATTAVTATNSPYGALGTISTLSSNLLSPATATNTGPLLTNNFVELASVAPDFFSGANPIPIADEEDDFNTLGNVTFATMSNHINWMVTNGLVQSGLNWVQVGDGVLTNLSGTSPSGRIDYWPTAFPNGGSNFVAFCHSNGVKVMQYISLSTSGLSSAQNPSFPYPQSISAADCLITNLNVDGLFIEAQDVTDDQWQIPLFLSEFARLGRPVFVHTPGGFGLPGSSGILSTSDTYQPWFNNWLNSHYAAPDGAADPSAPNNWTNFVIHLEKEMEFSPTTRRGHWIRSASVIWGTSNNTNLMRSELEAAVAMEGAWTYRYYQETAAMQMMTNQDFLTLWRDPLVMAAPVVNICATNGSVTNRVFAKPLERIGGSNALAWFLWKTNSSLTLTSTNLGFALNSVFTYYSPWSHAIEGWATNSLTLNNVASNSVLYKCTEGVVLPPLVGGTNFLGNLNFRLNATNGNSSATCGWIKNGAACAGATIELNGTFYSNGVSAVGPSYADYPLAGMATNFSCVAGIQDNFASAAAVQWTFYTNGVQAFQTGWITNAVQDTNVSFPLFGVNDLGIFVNGTQNTAPDPSWEVGALGNAILVTPGLQFGTFIGDGSGLHFNTLSPQNIYASNIFGSFVVSSNLPIIWPRDIIPSSTGGINGDTYDNANTESPVSAEESIKLPTTSTLGTAAWHVPRWATNAISELELQFNGSPPGCTITNDISAFYYPTNNGGRVGFETESAQIWQLGTNISAFTVTNHWPDTNCDKIVRIISGNYGAPTNTSAPVRILRVKVQCSGNVITITNQ